MQKAAGFDVIGEELARHIRNFTFSGERKLLNILREPMPYGEVLIVDDVDTNLYVAEGLMLPYGLKAETVTSGFAAIEKAREGRTYDVIFMDHMMPLMDGIETTQKLRGMGYNGAVVALTANALAGNDRMFKENGFDGFIAKPIDVRQLNETLNKFVRDRHPDKAIKYKTKMAAPEPAAVNPKLFQIFCRDAEKAIVTLRQTAESGDIKLFTTTAHAMKSALANVGEHDASKQAFTLERAGLEGDTEFILCNTEAFIETLEAAIKRLRPVETANESRADVKEDIAFLAEQLNIVKTACGDYDDTAAYAALDRLGEKLWKNETSAALEEIRDALFLHSDFDGAAERVETILASLPQ